MLKLWLYIILVLLFLIFIIIATHYNNYLQFCIYTELLWMFLFLLSILSCQYFNEPRFILFGFLVLYIATVEIIFFSMYLSIKF